MIQKRKENKNNRKKNAKNILNRRKNNQVNKTNKNIISQKVKWFLMISKDLFVMKKTMKEK